MNNYEISKEIERRRVRNEKERLRRIEKIEKTCPEYVELQTRRNALLAQAAIYRITDQKDKALLNEKEAENLTLIEKKLLKKLGLDESYLEVQYDCPKCNDVGFLEDGTICECLENLIKAENFNRFDLTEKTKLDNFDNFDLDLFSDKDAGRGMSYKQLAQFTLNKIKLYCKNFNESPHSLLFSGKPGTGKTFLVSCIVNELLKENRDIIYISSPNLINLLHDDIREKKSSKDSYKTAFKNTELLIIDDLGTEANNDFTRSSISEIIDERLVSKKPTILTTNLGSKDLKLRYPSRMASRILGLYETIPFMGEDLRTRDKK